MATSATEQSPKRTIGRPFQKGTSGNPGGRKRRYPKNVTMLARDASAEAIRTLIAIMKDPGASPGVRTAAAEKVLDRAWGRPLQQAVVAVGTGKLSDLTDAQLLAIIAGEAVQDVLAPAMDSNVDTIEHEPES